MDFIEVLATIIIMLIIAIAVLHLLNGDFIEWATGKFKAESLETEPAKEKIK